MDMIQPLFTCSKWNMGKNFGLKFHISYVHMYTINKFFEIPPCGKKVIFVSEFVTVEKASLLGSKIKGISKIFF